MKFISLSNSIQIIVHLNHSDEEIEVKEFIKEEGWDEVKLNQYV